MKKLYLLLSVLLWTHSALAVHLQWSANPEPDIAGYRVFWGAQAGTYTATLDVGKVLTAILVDPAPGATAHYSLTAYNTAGMEGGYAADVSYVAPTPTPALVTIGGTVYQCGTKLPGAKVAMSGGAMMTVITDAVGHYVFTPVSRNSVYTVTVTKGGLAAGAAGIDTVDLIAVQRHYLGVTLLTGCNLAAADINDTNTVNTVDTVGIQRFILRQTGYWNVGKYRFNPISRTYQGVIGDMITEDYIAVLFGNAVP